MTFSEWLLLPFIVVHETFTELLTAWKERDQWLKVGHTTDETGEFADHEKWCGAFWTTGTECICNPCHKAPGGSCKCVRGAVTIRFIKKGRITDNCNEASGEINSSR